MPKTLLSPYAYAYAYAYAYSYAYSFAYAYSYAYPYPYLTTLKTLNINSTYLYKLQYSLQITGTPLHRLFFL